VVHSAADTDRYGSSNLIPSVSTAACSDAKPLLNFFSSPEVIRLTVMMYIGYPLLLRQPCSAPKRFIELPDITYPHQNPVEAAPAHYFGGDDTRE